MSTDRWETIQQLFHASLQRAENERAQFLLDECHGDLGIYREVAGLLESFSESGEFLSRLTVPAIPEVDDSCSAEDWTGRQLGPYRILRKLGSGGMGSVFLAERSDGEFELRVAIKSVRTHLDREAVVQRFAIERRILARLNHPSIARLLDAGTTDDGIAYVVMEYVEGTEIDSYCDKHRLSLEDRLRLFQKVCSAVDYAHRNLIIHRDLKPANILVTSEGEVKLLDFGIAKLLEPDEEHSTLVPALTPEYASPEQFRGEAFNTGTDIYSLGVLLYRLLTGGMPCRFDLTSPATWSGLAYSEPTSPVDYLERLPREAGGEGPSLVEAARMRSTDPSTLIRILQGDLENILLVALRREAERRYGSARGFAEDVERYLEGMPVLAQPDTLRYRVGKFLGRHRTGVAIGCLFILGCLVGTGAIIYQARLASAERDRAQSESRKAAAVSEFLEQILYSVNPDWTQPGPRNASIEDLLRNASEKIRTGLEDQPEVRVRLLKTVGLAYRALGRYPEAARNLREAFETENLIKNREGPSFETPYFLAQTLLLKGDFSEADWLFRYSIGEMRRAFSGPELILLGALNDYAVLKNFTGRPEEAEPLLVEAQQLEKELYGRGHPTAGIIRSNLGVVEYLRGDFESATAFFREALGIYASLSPAPNMETSLALARLGEAEAAMGNHASARAHLDEARKLMIVRLGESHPYVAFVLTTSAYLNALESRFELAREEILRALELRRAVLDEDHPMIASSLAVAGFIEVRSGRFREGLEPLEKAYSIQSQLLSNDSWVLAETQNWLVPCLFAVRQVDRARNLREQSLEVLRLQLGEAHPKYLEATRIAALDPSPVD